MRRLLLDVAWALNGFQAAERRDIVFDWPQPGAFFRHQARTVEDVRVLISGARVVTLLGQSSPAESCILNGWLYVRPGPLDATAKRSVWRLIQEFDADGKQ